MSAGSSVGDVRYTRNGDVHLAYRIVGSGPRDLLLMSTWFVPIEAIDDGLAMRRAVERLADFGRVVMFDRRGVGLSDPISSGSPPTLEEWSSDALAVGDAIGLSSPVVLGLDPSGAQVAMYMAATHPETVGTLVLFNANARGSSAADYPIGPEPDQLRERIDGIVESFMAGDAGFGPLVPTISDHDPVREWWIRWRRRGASPGTIRTLLTMSMFADLRALLSEVRAPTLVLHRRGSQTFPISSGRYLAEHIPSAIFRELPGDESLFFVGDVDGLLAEIEEFLTGARHVHRTKRVVSTILFSDLVESTSIAARLGDGHWHDLLDAHNAAVRRQLERFDGREVGTTGDGFLAIFEGPAQAIRCAEAMRDVVGRLGLQLRSGIHTGQIELTETDVLGLGVHIGQRVSSLASSGEILVSRTVVDLLAGSGLTFTDRGEHQLKGVPGTWGVFALRTD